MFSVQLVINYLLVISNMSLNVTFTIFSGLSNFNYPFGLKQSIALTNELACFLLLACWLPSQKRLASLAIWASQPIWPKLAFLQIVRLDGPLTTLMHDCYQFLAC
jgi:hypothetical protein